MRAQIEEQTASLLLGCVLAPGIRIDRRAVALVAALEAHDLAQRARRQQRLKRAKIAIPAAILEDRQRNIRRAGRLDQLARAIAGGSERLVDDDRQARLDGGHPRARWLSFGVATTTRSIAVGSAKSASAEDRTRAVG